MSENILNNIITKKIEKIDLLKKSTSLVSLNEIIDKNSSYVNFKEKIETQLKQKVGQDYRGRPSQKGSDHF